jgi:hypothetical protein
MKTTFLITVLSVLSLVIVGQNPNQGTFLKPNPANYEVKQALEIESLVPMFFYGGYHVGVGYRYKKFRVRMSVIYGGDYDAETAGVNNSSPDYKRYYQPSPGFFAGYNLWKNLELYGYYERHTFNIEQVASTEQHNLKSNDVGLGISYQFFIGRVFYVQPGFHTYFRADNSVNFTNGQTYNIPNMDYSAVIRLGARLWRNYE